MISLKETFDRNGREIKIDDAVEIDGKVLSLGDSNTGRIMRIEQLGNLALVYVFHRTGKKGMDVTPFNRYHLKRL